MIVASQGTSQLVSGANVLESSIASNTAAITGGLPVAEVTPVAVTTVVSTRECAPLECSHCVVGAHKAPWGLTSLFIADESTFNACIALAFSPPSTVVVVGSMELSSLTTVTWRLNSTHLACEVVHKEKAWCVPTALGPSTLGTTLAGDRQVLVV